MTRIRYTMSARLVEKDVHRWVFAHNMDPDVETLVRATPKTATLELCDRLSNPLIEVDAVVNGDCPDAVCDLGYGIAPGTVIDEGTIPDYHVLWPGKPTTNTVWTAVEDCTPAPHLQSKRKTEDGRSER